MVNQGKPGLLAIPWAIIKQNQEQSGHSAKLESVLPTKKPVSHLGRSSTPPSEEIVWSPNQIKASLVIQIDHSLTASLCNQPDYAM